ncbi:hypothetical protein PP304_gp114 [Gordonia phage Phendrix]|uniref:Uncharacterized protein n=1 Tax=Gordonia phage Phendrix TaxID=2593335 RepID=A0A514U144_9CAUD|nr:hypothetical protein PP304_gp114 [Gordonia phage Phendrix]QDK02662.1 hypothetical protein SEA_PHENDRIX_114 [Gordonia phage Phendrix]
MKAIVTGFSADAARGNSRVGYESLPLGLVRAGRKMGWEVSHQPMMVATNDDDLDAADLMFVGLGPFNAVGSRYFIGALDAVAKARQHNCALLFYVTDWQTHLLKTSIATVIKYPHNITKQFLFNRTDFTWGAHHIDYLRDILVNFRDRPWPETLVPMQTWHTDPSRDGTKISSHVPARRICTLDPTSVTTATWDIPEPDWSIKERKYTVAALGDYSKYISELGMGWEVNDFGSKATHGKDSERTTVTRPTEKQINELYRTSWAGVCTRTPMYNTGWWRTRYDFISRAGAITIGDPAELSIIGDAYGLSCADLEAMTDNQLLDTAHAQRAQYEARIEPEASVLQKLEEAYLRAKADIDVI